MPAIPAGQQGTETMKNQAEMTINEPIERPVNDWNAQRTVTLIVEALNDLGIECRIISAVSIYRNNVTPDTLEVYVADEDCETLFEGSCVIDDNNQADMNAIYDKIRALFPARQESTEQPF